MSLLRRAKPTPPPLQEPDDADFDVLRKRALNAHRESVGHGGELVDILKNTIIQIEKANRRVQWMSGGLFLAGLAVLGVGVYETVSGGADIWAALLGTTGGVTAVAATFLTAPMDRITASTKNLVRLETAFLGYIRILGEVDSAFQMQYLDIADKRTQVSLDQVIQDTTNHMTEAMKLTIDLIDRIAAEDGQITELADNAKKLEARILALESAKH
jgi:hypothetical protein